MKTTFISTASFLNQPRANWGQLRSDIVKANVEISTGRLADAGLALGARTGQGLSIRHDDAGLQALIDDDSTLSARLDQSQAALKSMADGANSFLTSLVAIPGDSSADSVLE